MEISFRIEQKNKEKMTKQTKEQKREKARIYYNKRRKTEKGKLEHQKALKKYQLSPKGKIAFFRANVKKRYGILRFAFDKLVSLGCEECGFNEYNLDFHHIDKNTKNNELTNIKYLCPNCHMRYHR